jgi:hypothetical protein
MLAALQKPLRRLVRPFSTASLEQQKKEFEELKRALYS